jgi:hypothetical protein
MPALGRIDLARPWDDENRQQEQDHAADGEKSFTGLRKGNYCALERWIRGLAAAPVAGTPTEN